MKTGKIPENVLKRSVLKQVKRNRDEVLIGAGIGENCAILSFGTDQLISVSSVPAAGQRGGMVKYPLYHCVNHLASSGADPVGITISSLFPINAEEADIKKMMLQIEAECKILNVQIMGCQVEMTDAVIRPVLTISGIGKLEKSHKELLGKAKPDQDVVISKWIGLEGTSVLAREKEAELLRRYPAHLVEAAKGFDKFLPIIPEAATAVKSGVRAMHDVTEGGIFGALWEMAEGANVGLEIDLKKLPVKQETIEVCEFFEISPYELLSGGCLLMTADNGHDLVKALEREGIPAAVVGKTTDTNDRVIINEEEKRFLEPSKSDELYKVI